MSHSHYSTITVFFTAVFLLSLSATTAAVNRRLLHHYFPVVQPISQPPDSSPTPQPQPQQQQPKYPFSSFYPPNPTTTTPQSPFFPFTHLSPPPPPSPPSATTITLPANISSLVLPSSSSSNSHKTIKVISLILSLSLFTFLFFTSLLYFIFRHRLHHNHRKTETVHLFPPGSTPSDTPDNTKKPPPLLFPRHASTSKSSEFLYLGTLVSSRDAAHGAPSSTVKEEKATPAVSYQRLGSPELRPLPPLPRQPSPFNSQNFSKYPASNEDEDNVGNLVEEDGGREDEFFSPRESTENFDTPPPYNEFIKSRSLNSSDSCSPSVVLNPGTTRSTGLSSPESLSDFPTPLPPFVFPSPPSRTPRAFSACSPPSTEDCSTRESDFSAAVKVSSPRPPPSPPPKAIFREVASAGGPPELVAPSREVVNGRKRSFGNSEEIGKPKLKPLHWDKVRACSDKTMVWDQLKSSSFQLNEEMIESLFMASSLNMNGKELKRLIIPDANQETLILDPKKSQNIAILLRALNVTIEEVCEALMEGNTDTLGTELLESLLKMAPTKEEELKLMEFKDDSPYKLEAAETFLKSVLDIPHAFKRIEAMLYIGNFESEIDYLKRSFSTLETACKELKSSRMFRKLLEAVLRTGNRMNVGTNRGNAHAFKLDSLLQLVDIKGTDGKTSLLHFVVQEIIKTEGARRFASDQNLEASTDKQCTLSDEVEFRKIGLQVVSALSGELTNVKKAATFDADVLSNDMAKLAKGINLITEVLKLNEDFLVKDKFSDFLREFLSTAEAEIANVHVQEGIALSMVKGLTEYIHGDLAEEEAHPFRLFMVVRDFLFVLDKVCKDIGKMNERTMVSPGLQIQESDNMASPWVFQGFGERQEEYSSSDDGSSFSSK